MKWINKGPEPVSFTEWKEQANEDWRPTWDGFSNPQKAQLHETLLMEQGYVCCYCNDRIGRPSPESHIEHIKPRSHFDSDTLDYVNLVSSCQGENEKRLPVHCGPAKADWPDATAFAAGLMVSPLDKDCETAFSFTVIGEIRPVAGHARYEGASETIKRLGLNVGKLDAARRRAIEGVLEDIEDETVEDLQRLISYFSEKDNDGRFQPFCSAVIYTLRRYLTLPHDAL